MSAPAPSSWRSCTSAPSTCAAFPPSKGGVGEPADATAAGVHAGILATLDHVFGSRDVAGRHFVVAGLGQVGGRLAARSRRAAPA